MEYREKRRCPGRLPREGHRPVLMGARSRIADLKGILQAGLQAPSGYNLQPWRFIVVRNPDQKKKLRAACFNQAKVEEASVMIVACGDADGWRSGDLDEMLRLGRQGGMPENYAEQAKATIPNYPVQPSQHALVAQSPGDAGLYPHVADGGGAGLRHRAHGGL